MHLLLKLTGFLLLSCISVLQAQTLNYQGIARNVVGEPLANRTIALRLSIKDAPDNGNTLYTEIKSVTTNGFGLYTVAINDGEGTRTGNFAGIDWSQQRFIQTEADPDGGTAFTDLGTAPLHSVPQAFNAMQAATLKGIPEPKEGYFVEFRNGEWVQKPKPKRYHAVEVGANPQNTLNFIGRGVEVTIEEDDPVITATISKVFDTSGSGGADGLIVNLGYKKNGSGESIQYFRDPIGMTGLRTSKDTRLPISLSGSFKSNFKKGETYYIGMVGFVTGNLASQWNNNGTTMCLVEVSY